MSISPPPQEQEIKRWKTIFPSLTKEEIRAIFTGERGVPRWIPLGLVVEASGKPKGVKIVQVEPKSPAARVSLLKGDVITQVEKFSISTPEAFWVSVGSFSPGSVVALTLVHPPSPRPSMARLTLVPRPMTAEFSEDAAAVAASVTAQTSPLFRDLAGWEQELAYFKSLTPQAFALGYQPRLSGLIRAEGAQVAVHLPAVDRWVEIGFPPTRAAALKALTQEMAALAQRAGGRDLERLEDLQEVHAFLVQVTDDAYLKNLDGLYMKVALTNSAQPDNRMDFLRDPWLGVTNAEGLDYHALHRLGVAAGIKVTGIDPGSPADGRLALGDIVVAIGDRPVPDGAALQAILKTCAIGIEITMDVIRGAKRLPVEATLGEHPGLRRHQPR